MELDAAELFGGGILPGTKPMFIENPVAGSWYIHGGIT